MAPQNEPSSSSANLDGGVDNKAPHGSGQSKTTNKPSSKASKSSKSAKGKSSTSSSTTRKPVKKTAVPSAPSKDPQPSSSATAAAKQLGAAASASIDPATSHSPSSQSSLDGSIKRNHDEAFMPSSHQDVHKPFHLGDDQPKKPEYPRRGAPPDAITKYNEPRSEVMSICSENEDGPDSDDEPLLATHKRRMTSTSGTPSPSGGQQMENACTITSRLEKDKHQLKQKINQQSMEIQSLNKQLRDSQAMCEKAKGDQVNKDQEILIAGERLDIKTRRVQSLESQNEALNGNIVSLRNRASREKEAAHQTIIKLQKQADALEKRVFSETMRCSELNASNKRLSHRQSDLEQINSDLMDKQAQLKVQYDHLDAEYGNRGADLEKLEAEHDELKTKYDELKAERDELQSECKYLEAKKTRLEEDNDHQNLCLDELEEKLEQEKARTAQAVPDASTQRRVEELEQQVSAQNEKLHDYEKKAAGLSEELDWKDKRREERESEWEKKWNERLAMEEKWRAEIMAILNENNASMAERVRAGPGASGPIQQAGQGEAPRPGGSQRNVAQRDAAQRDASRGSSSHSGGPSR